MLLVPANESSIRGLLTLEKEIMSVSMDEMKQSICLSSVDGTHDTKRSVKRLQESGLVPTHGDAIANCPLNADQTCLILRDDRAPSKSL